AMTADGGSGGSGNVCVSGSFSFLLGLIRGGYGSGGDCAHAIIDAHNSRATLCRMITWPPIKILSPLMVRAPASDLFTAPDGRPLTRIFQDRHTEFLKRS